MEFKCPKCQTVIYSRKHKTCGHCGEALPVELLLTPDQVRELEEQRKVEQKRVKEFDLGGDSV
jgi:hypothetical protein